MRIECACGPAQCCHAAQSTTFLFRQQRVEFTFDKQHGFITFQGSCVIKTLCAAACYLGIFRQSSGATYLDGPQFLTNKPGDRYAARNCEVAKPEPAPRTACNVAKPRPQNRFLGQTPLLEILQSAFAFRTPQHALRAIHDFLGVFLPGAAWRFGFSCERDGEFRATGMLGSLRSVICPQIFTGFCKRQPPVALKPVQYIALRAARAKAAPTIFPDCQTVALVFVVK